jgi:hypothetical protein
MDIPEYYVNQVGFSFSVYDMTFSFGIQGKETKPVVTIRMSPLHALVMSKILQKNLNLYEGKIGGKLQLPEDMCKEFGIKNDEVPSLSINIEKDIDWNILNGLLNEQKRISNEVYIVRFVVNQ